MCGARQGKRFVNEKTLVFPSVILFTVLVIWKGVVSLASRGLIVLAEDDARMRRLYVAALTNAGFNVLAAGDGVEALSYLSKVTPRLVILDIMMPKLNGIETCTRARKIIGNDIPILFLSALDRIDILRDCVAAGGDDYLIKSDSLASLVERIETWLQAAQRQGLSTRRAKMLQDVSARVESGDSAPVGTQPAKTDEADEAAKSDMAGLLSQVQEALHLVGPTFGKTPEHKLRLTGYVAGVIESWAENQGAAKDVFLKYLQEILQNTGLVSKADAAETAATYDKLSRDMTFRLGRTRGRNDAARRQKEGNVYRMAGLADPGSTGASEATDAADSAVAS